MQTIALILSLFLPPCQYEDSANCRWDASQSGNGTGQSFIDLGGTVYMLPE